MSNPTSTGTPDAHDIIANLMLQPQRLASFGYSSVPDGRGIALVPIGQSEPLIPVVVRVLPGVPGAAASSQYSTQESQTHVHAQTGRVVDAHSTPAAAKRGVAFLTTWANGSQAELVIAERAALQRMLDCPSPSNLVGISLGRDDNLALRRSNLPATNSSLTVVSSGVVAHRFQRTVLCP